VSLAPHLLVTAPLKDLGQGATVPIGSATLRHLRKVLRLTDGAELSVTDGAGRWTAAVLAGDLGRLAGPVHSVHAPVPRLVLAQSLSKGRRAEDAVRAACELGAGRVVPVIATRTQGRPDAHAAEVIVERWRAVAVAALEQSRGVHLTEILAPITTDVLLARPPTTGALRLVAVPGADALPIVLGGALGGVAEAATRVSEVVVAVGPEGGWSPEEVASAGAAGWLAVGLGPTVLRTEHAGPVAVAVLAALTGRWDVPRSEVVPEDPAWITPASGERGATLDIRPSRSTDAL
jgi:16S rRNA (uracil1498-N3)-methyltransferase